MLTDRQGNALSGATAEAAALYDRALEAYNPYRGDPVALVDQAIEAAPDFAIARILKAYLFALSTEPAATAAAKEIVLDLKKLRLCDREASHVAALGQLVKGEWSAAAVALDFHNMRYPRDLAALQAGHLMDFFRANARNLRDRLARALPEWDRRMPGYSILLGMYAFGLEEAGDYAKAEDAGREAVDLEPLDCWAHHAVAHVLEMQGRAEEGVEWMDSRVAFWSGDDNLFKVHNWWHQAMFHLSLDQPNAALALYDAELRKGESGVAADLIDASSLLWRMMLAGADVGDRWLPLSKAWDQHADGALYSFNDWHAVMTYLGAGRPDQVARILGAYQGTHEQDSEQRAWARKTGAALIEGFAAFWRKDYGVAVDRLYKARYIANAFGGSHAQRDVIDVTLLKAATHGGFADLAGSLSNERTALKPASPANKRKAARPRAPCVMARAF